MKGVDEWNLSDLTPMKGFGGQLRTNRLSEVSPRIEVHFDAGENMENMENVKTKVKMKVNSTMTFGCFEEQLLPVLSKSYHYEFDYVVCSGAILAMYLTPTIANPNPCCCEVCIVYIWLPSKPFLKNIP